MSRSLLAVAAAGCLWLTVVVCANSERPPKTSLKTSPKTGSPPPSQSGSARRRVAAPGFSDNRAYRSPGEWHKAIVYAADRAIRDRLIAGGGRVLQDYGAFSLMYAPDNALSNGGEGGETPRGGEGKAGEDAQQSNAGVAVRDDLNLILLRARQFDTSVQPSEHVDEAQSATASEQAERAASGQLYLIQMAGPIKTEWYEWLAANADIVSYIPNDAYLVRPRAGSASVLKPAAAGGQDFIQWVGAYRPDYKLSPTLDLGSLAAIPITVQLRKTERIDEDLAEIARLAEGPATRPMEILKFVDVGFRALPETIERLISNPDILWVEPNPPTKLMDEVQGQIVAGNYEGGIPTAPGYLSWLASKNLASNPDFTVDISDTGLDQGNFDPNVLHKVFLNAAGSPRIVYARFMDRNGDTASLDDTTGHGTLNASILAGFGSGSLFPDADSGGYNFGLGVDPYAQLGITKVFNPDFTNPDYVAMIASAYQLGARVSSDSWGQGTNAYTTTSQIYDAAVRDSDPGTPGNQEMSFVFSVGNAGPFGNIASPATAKNVIAVGATQSYRPTGTDGCGFGPDDASQVDSIIGFSSGGPVQDGRIKPDVVAPGTHIEGALSQDPNNQARGICGPKDFPAGQTLYTWSSGTSHSAPAVAGAAALARQYFETYTGKAPSPAMIKAFLLNSTTYLTGAGAGDNLPGLNQGWGLVDLGRALDETPRVLVDQSQLLTATGQTFSFKAHIVDPSKQLRATLVWTDAPGNPSANPVVNDLDLRVVYQGVQYLGNNLSSQYSVIGGRPDVLNNVESVWMPQNVSGDIEIDVIAANLTGDGVPGNGSPVDQDFALVVYNAVPLDSIDSPPSISLTYPLGGEKVVSGSVARIAWSSSDDHKIAGQDVMLSTDGGATYTQIAALDGTARSFNWLVPQIPTSAARIKVLVSDGVNLPVSGASGDFEIDIGPPDTTPPTVSVIAPAPGTLIGGGTAFTISWTETDDVGVVKRQIDLSTDGGVTFSTVYSLVAAGSGLQTYLWQAPAGLSTRQGVIRITVYDGAGNSATAKSSGLFQVWALPVITSATFSSASSSSASSSLSSAAADGQLLVQGREFRPGEDQLLAGSAVLKKVRFEFPSASGDGTFTQLTSADRKLAKRLPLGKAVTLTVKVVRTGQVSPPFQFVRE